MSRGGARGGQADTGSRSFQRPRGILQWATAAYLVLLPLGTGFVFPRSGAVATLADGFLAALLAVAAGIGVVRLLGWNGDRAGEGPGIPATRGASAALALLFAFGAWAALSVLWSPAPSYAALKGAGYVALAAGAGVVAWSGLGWTRGLDAWLAGTGLVLLLTVAAALVGSGGSGLDVVYQGGSVRGLPVPRLRGPFFHPNGFGDYLVLSGAFLWARWPAYTARPKAPEGPGEGDGSRIRWLREAAFVGAALLLAVTILTVSSAWLGAGVLLLVWGRRLARDARRGVGGPGASVRALLLRGTGAAIAGVVLAGLVVPIRIAVAGVGLTTSGIRPRIWTSSLQAVLEAPVMGVGSFPYLARAVDPLSPAAGPVPWDAHSVYLSVLGQFGIVGFVLLGGAAWLLARHLRRPGGPGRAPDLAVVSEDPGPLPPSPVLRDRARLALLAGLLAMAVHGLAIAGEDLRHWWAVLGLAATAVATGGSASRREG